MIASCGFLENDLIQISKEQGVTLADSLETLGVDLRTRVKRLGAKEKATRKKCLVRFSIIKKNKVFQKNYMKVGVKKLLRAGMMPTRTWREGEKGCMQWGWLPLKVKKIEETNGSCSGQKKSTTSLSLFIEAYGLEVEEELSTMATQHSVEGVWTGKWSYEQKEARVRQIREVQTWKQER